MSTLPSSAASAQLLPERVFFRADPAVTVVRPALGLTLYLDDAPAWSIGAAADLLERFLEMPAARGLRFFATSNVRGARSVDAGVIRDLVPQVRSMSLRGGMRHLWQVRFGDDPWAPGLAFVYREVDPRVAPLRRGYVQIFLPPLSHSDDLLALTIEACQRFPVWAGVGGICASWNARRPLNAFHTIHRWTRRWMGLDVQAPDAMGLHVDRGLPGVSWLTVLGHEAMRRWDLSPADLAQRTWRNDVTVLSLARAAVVRAGRAPVAGDVNLMDFPASIAEVAGALHPWVLADPPPLPGPFAEGTVTLDWYHRFIRPEAWS